MPFISHKIPMSLTMSLLCSLMLLVAGAAYFLPGFAQAERQNMESIWLITEEEGLMEEGVVEPDGFSKSITGGKRVTPIITVKRPDITQKHHSPIGIDVTFQPVGGSPLDLSSVKVKLLKFITIDITDRVKAYITQKGIHVKSVKVPKGKHRIEFSIADNQGRRASKIIQLTII